MVNRGNLVGIVYLENNLISGVFRKERIELLKLLSGQMAISISNALLYEEREEYTRILEEKVKQRTAELEKANQELSNIAYIDKLTKIANRRQFDYSLAQEWHRHLREKKPLAMILIDIDYFKRYNDHYGHQAGDKCLTKVAQAIAEVPHRATDLVARYGGEEFALILPDTDEDGAVRIAESIKQVVAEKEIPHAKSEVNDHVTLSMGVSSFIPDETIDMQSVISRADEALYMAKEKGRNQVVLF